MRVFFSLCLSVMLGTVPASADTDVGAFMTATGELRDELRLRDSQHGFAGETGTVWVIAPSGAFTVSRFLNRKIEPPRQDGQLSDQQLRALAQSLQAGGFEGLPPQIGQPVPVNARVISVTFGSDSVDLMLAPDPTDLRSLAARAATRAPAERGLLAIAAAILAATAPD